MHKSEGSIWWILTCNHCPDQDTKQSSLIFFGVPQWEQDVPHLTAASLTKSQCLWLLPCVQPHSTACQEVMSTFSSVPLEQRIIYSLRKDLNNKQPQTPVIGPWKNSNDRIKWEPELKMHSTGAIVKGQGNVLGSLRSFGSTRTGWRPRVGWQL